MTLNELRGMTGRSLMIVIALGFCFCPMVTGHPEWALPLVGVSFLIASANFVVGFAKVLEITELDQPESYDDDLYPGYPEDAILFHNGKVIKPEGAETIAEAIGMIEDAKKLKEADEDE